MDNRQLLRTLSTKLGIADSKILRKAEEFLRLLAVHSGAGLALSSSAKTVISLEIAAVSLGASVDKSTAVKLSGLTRPQYVSSSQTVNQMLNVSSSVRIADLCITHSATNAKDLAYQIIKEYEHDLKDKGTLDLSLPVFQTAAVVAACGVMKIKLDKRKMYEASSSKKAVYTKVVEAMTRIAEKLHAKKSVKPGGKRSKTLLDLVEDNMQDSSATKVRKCEDVDARNSDEENESKEGDFEEWKKKILLAAGASV